MNEIVEQITNLKINFKKLAIFFLILLIFGILVNWLAFPFFLKRAIQNKVVLTPKSETRKLWEKVPFPVDFKVYVFNITNPDEVTNGGRPHVQEVGPFFFDEWKEKYDLEDDEEKDTVTYHMRNTFIFRPDKSCPLTGKEVITIPHPLVMPLSVAVKRDQAPMMPLVSEAINTMFPVEKPFYTAPFMDLFFNGIPVDCSSEVFAVKAVCTQFATGEVKGGVKYNETHYVFSLMGGANGTDAGKFTVYRGKKRSLDVGRLLLFDDEEELVTWGEGGECNKYKGTDSTIFPPFLKKEDGLWAFAADLCISLGAYYERPSSFMGIKTLRYTIDFGDLKNEPEKHCYCTNPPDGCPPKGTMALSKCVGGPLVISLPHLYLAEPKLFDEVTGLKPNEKDHKIYLEYEIMTGTPLSAAKRLQFNLDVESVEEIESMKNIRKMILPFFWVEESAELNKTYADMFKKLFLTIEINNSLKWTFTFFGGVGFLMCMYFNSLKPKIKEVQSQKKVGDNFKINLNVNKLNDTVASESNGGTKNILERQKSNDSTMNNSVKY
ncbi:sensory neuron membrane protein 1-like [Condylostylus longicornis]|uniref:sensory neuron membrane protein 1-like n=1 Tax=Condylostylus longicornis TaxID=2530218 RepID=UPI00244DF5ED|nr:sensory neuron membrane protein 1-like [Condylostylus longicornis]